MERSVPLLSLPAELAIALSLTAWKSVAGLAPEEPSSRPCAPTRTIVDTISFVCSGASPRLAAASPAPRNLVVARALADTLLPVVDSPALDEMTLPRYAPLPTVLRYLNACDG